MNATLIPKKNELIQDYHNNFNLTDLQNKYSVGRKTIAKFLKDCGVELRKTTCKYTMNESFFEKIDSKEKAYILGILASDGNNDPTRNRVRITLQERDKHILEEISNIIGSNRPLSYEIKNRKVPSYQNVYTLLMHGEKICKDLELLGVVAKKTNILVWPDWLEDGLIPSYIRGLMDGDGCLTPDGIHLTLTINVLTRIKEIVKEKLGIEAKIYFPKALNQEKNIRVFQIQGRRQVKKFLDWIYEDSTIHLNRKYETYKNIKNWKTKIEERATGILNEDNPVTAFTLKRNLQKLERARRLRTI